MDSITREIAEFASSFIIADVNHKAIHAAIQRLIDSLGCAVGAYDCEPALIGRRLAQNETPGQYGAPHFVFRRPVAGRSRRFH